MNILEIYDDRIRTARALSADAFYVQELNRLESERSALSDLIEAVRSELFYGDTAHQKTQLRAALARVQP